MNPKISLIINSRVEGNVNHGLRDLLDDLTAMTKDMSNIEVLVKFDECDSKVEDYGRDLFYLYAQKHHLSIKRVITPRRRGYADLHCGYADLMPHVAESSIMVGAIADDMRVIHEGWDELLLKTAGNKKLFIIHPHKANENVNINNLEGTVHDESPFWSKELIHLCQCNWWIYATDAWTTAIEYWLKQYKCDITLLTHIGIFRRKFNGAIDTQQNTKRWTVRSDMFKFTTTPFFQKMIRLQALSVAKEIHPFYAKTKEISSCQNSLV